MSWSKVRSGKYPLGWWYHKIICEIGYFIEKKINSVQGMGMYYYHLQMMCDKYNLNLYGEKL